MSTVWKGESNALSVFDTHWRGFGNLTFILPYLDAILYQATIYPAHCELLKTRTCDLCAVIEGYRYIVRLVSGSIIQYSRDGEYDRGIPLSQASS